MKGCIAARRAWLFQRQSSAWHNEHPPQGPSRKQWPTKRRPGPLGTHREDAAAGDAHRISITPDAPIAKPAPDWPQAATHMSSILLKRH